MFDSGAGGLSVLGHLRALAPREKYIYFADTQYFPYGPRPAAEVRKRAFAISHRLLQSDVKMIVIACNTASTAAVKDLRDAFEVPFVAMVPAIKPAAALSPSGRVAVLATSGTIDGHMYASVMAEFGQTADVRAVPCPGLAERVEAGDSASDSIRAELHDALDPAVRNGVDTVVLGCTHFHFLAGLVAEEYPGVNVIGTAEPVARRAASVLDDSGLEAPRDASGGVSFIVSGNRSAFLALADALNWSQLGVNS